MNRRYGVARIGYPDRIRNAKVIVDHFETPGGAGAWRFINLHDEGSSFVVRIDGEDLVELTKDEAREAAAAVGKCAL